MKKKIIEALRRRGPMTSDELCEALGIEWTDFSTILKKMLNKGQVFCTRCTRNAEKVPIYHLSDQKVE